MNLAASNSSAILKYLQAMHETSQHSEAAEDDNVESVNVEGVNMEGVNVENVEETSKFIPEFLAEEEKIGDDDFDYSYVPYNHNFKAQLDRASQYQHAVKSPLLARLHAIPRGTAQSSSCNSEVLIRHGMALDRNSVTVGSLAKHLKDDADEVRYIDTLDLLNSLIS